MVISLLVLNFSHIYSAQEASLPVDVQVYRFENRFAEGKRVKVGTRLLGELNHRTEIDEEQYDSLCQVAYDIHSALHPERKHEEARFFAVRNMFDPLKYCDQLREYTVEVSGSVVPGQSKHTLSTLITVKMVKDAHRPAVTSAIESVAKSLSRYTPCRTYSMQVSE